MNGRPVGDPAEHVIESLQTSGIDHRRMNRSALVDVSLHRAEENPQIVLLQAAPHPDEAKLWYRPSDSDLSTASGRADGSAHVLLQWLPFNRVQAPSDRGFVKGHGSNTFQKS